MQSIGDSIPFNTQDFLTLLGPGSSDSAPTTPRRPNTLAPPAALLPPAAFCANIPEPVVQYYDFSREDLQSNQLYAQDFLPSNITTPESGEQVTSSQSACADIYGLSHTFASHGSPHETLCHSGIPGGSNFSPGDLSVMGGQLEELPRSGHVHVPGGTAYPLNLDGSEKHGNTLQTGGHLQSRGRRTHNSNYRTSRGPMQTFDNLVQQDSSTPPDRKVYFDFCQRLRRAGAVANKKTAINENFVVIFSLRRRSSRCMNNSPFFYMTPSARSAFDHDTRLAGVDVERWFMDLAMSS